MAIHWLSHLSHHSSWFGEHLCKSVCDEERGVDEPFHAVGDAGFSAGIEFAAWGAHACLPANVIHLVYHSLHLSLLLFQHKETLEFCISRTATTARTTVKPETRRRRRPEGGIAEGRRTGVKTRRRREIRRGRRERIKARAGGVCLGFTVAEKPTHAEELNNERGRQFRGGKVLREIV